MDMTAALRAAGELGPFFAVSPASTVPGGGVSSAAGEGIDGGGWRPLAELAEDPAVVCERVESARAVMAQRTGLDLDAVEPRATASIVFLGLAARLVSPPLASGVLAGAVPRWTSADLSWRPVPGGPWPLAARPTAAADVSEFPSVIVDGLVGPILAAFQREYRLSPKVLWGNVASGLAGAAGMIGRPEAFDLVDDVLGVPPLRGTGEFFRPDPTVDRRFFVRRSCCLFYRIPGAGTCGDCVLTPQDIRRRQWQAALSR